MNKRNYYLKTQVVPISLAVITFFILTLLLLFLTILLNYFPDREGILLQIKPVDVLIGLTIYIKTAIDFALFIGNTLATNKGPTRRVAIEVGTALGNGAGTLLILVIWYFFKAVPALLTLMMFLAALVLLRMAQEGFGTLLDSFEKLHVTFHRPTRILHLSLSKTNRIFDPIVSFILPNAKLVQPPVLPPVKLASFAFTIPFVLGLDNFAGYVPLFSIINIFGFSIGVFLGHLLLTASLFASPKRTANIVRNPVVLFFGSLVFIGLALYGLYEGALLLRQLF